MREIDFNGVGIRIKNIRLKKKMTQDQLAEKINSDRSVIARIESGNQGCSIDYLVKIANALETTSDALLADSLKYANTSSDELEIYQLLANCNAAEVSFILRCVSSLREILREFIIK